MLVKTLLYSLMKILKIEYTIDGEWQCWKISNGIAFCIRRSNYTMGTNPVAMMGGYYSYVSLKYPQNFFFETPICFANGRLGTGLGYCYVSSASKDQLTVYVFGNQVQKISMLELFAIGKWKSGGVVRLLKALISQEVAYGC